MRENHNNRLEHGGSVPEYAGPVDIEHVKEDVSEEYLQMSADNLKSALAFVQLDEDSKADNDTFDDAEI